MAFEMFSSYLKDAFNDDDELLGRATKALADVDYDTMVGTGLSGSLVIPFLARALGKYWMIVRKDDDSQHREKPAEGRLGRRWLFVDDFVDYGFTRTRVERCVESLALENDYETTYVGAYLYADHVKAAYLAPWPPAGETVLQRLYRLRGQAVCVLPYDPPCTPARAVDERVFSEHWQEIGYTSEGALD